MSLHLGLYKSSMFSISAHSNRLVDAAVINLPLEIDYTDMSNISFRDVQEMY